MADVTTQVIAHRGNSSVAPENTMAAFESAWRAGADVIELDIQLSSDGRAVVIHNDTVEETTDGSGPVSSRTAAQLAAFDAGSWFSEAYAGQRIPLLTEVLAWMGPRPPLELLLEFKGHWDAAPIDAVVRDIEAAELVERTVMQSFSVPTVHALADVAPDIRRGLLINTFDASTFSLTAQVRAAQCNPSGQLLLDQPDLLDRIRERGMQAMVWTVNEPEHWAALIRSGADGIITDRPDALRGFLAAQP